MKPMGSRLRLARLAIILTGLAVLPKSTQAAAEIARGGIHSVVELSFTGPQQGPTDTPARDVQFWVRFRHESGAPEYKVWGFWDSDGKGGMSGRIFKVRFCPTRTGRWNLIEVFSNARELAGQKQDDYVTAVVSVLPGFWMPDPESPGSRWYKRSDGSHPYIVGNTHYSFLSGYRDGGRPSGNDIADDMLANAEYFKKLRMGITGDRYVHPEEKPFLDESGKPTDAGDFSFRPNPKWFAERMDVAVAKGFERDLIVDLILAGPDTKDSRATLRAAKNNGDPAPFLRYMAARYGSYPNVWFCLCNEHDIKEPRYSEKDIARFGSLLRSFLPYPTPVSVHRSPSGWDNQFDDLPPWNDHQIIQKKLKKIAAAADAIQQTWQGASGKGPRNKPTVNDELSYEGAGDKHLEGDTIEAHLGAFLGGGYGTTGEKHGNKLGQYFWGKFDPNVHTAADNLKYLREVIDANITFWKMAPDLSIFSNLDPGFRGMAWPDNEYVLGTNKEQKGIVAKLPAGRWNVKQYDIMAMETKTVGENVSGEFTFDAPASRAVLYHFKKVSK
ncbi:MAG: DUF5060 domain-containing protein [Candidatus Sumerlaeia bacterium]|nr:DUF5060 domain-containing protein [Candidatus Sumerlaeia bacterium]